jgi:hypothetical protein
MPCWETSLFSDGCKTGTGKELIARAAPPRSLGLNPSTLRSRIKKLGISRALA